MGRGEMPLSILIETMRREAYELQVSTPHVLTKVIDGKTTSLWSTLSSTFPPSIRVL